MICLAGKNNNILEHLTPTISITSTSTENVRVEIFPGFTTLGIFGDIPKMMNTSQCEPMKLKQ